MDSTRLNSKNKKNTPLNWALGLCWVTAFFFMAVPRLGAEDLAPGEAEYMSGEESRKAGNDNEAFKWYLKSAELGNSKGEQVVGYCYKEGSGVSKNESEAMKWSTKSAAQGNSNADWILGGMYEYGSGVPVDYLKAKTWYEKGARDGGKDFDPYIHGVEDKMWLADYKPSADGEAEYACGKRAEDSNNYKGALDWFQKSAKIGNPKAEYELGKLYQDYWIPWKDSSKSDEWYEKAFADGIDPTTGIFHTPPPGNKEFWKGQTAFAAGHYEEAANWYQKSADLHHPDALIKLGKTYSAMADNSIGQKEEDCRGKSFFYYEQAAMLGEKGSEEIIRADPSSDLILPFDYRSEVKWLKKEAARGNQLAAQELEDSRVRFPVVEVTAAPPTETPTPLPETSPSNGGGGTYAAPDMFTGGYQSDYGSRSHAAESSSSNDSSASNSSSYNSSSSTTSSSNSSDDSWKSTAEEQIKSGEYYNQGKVNDSWHAP